MNRVVRLNISTTADEILRRMLTTVNADYVGGAINKSQLASWILTAFEKQLGRHLGTIRSTHFDQLTYVEAVLRQKKAADKTGAACPEFDDLVKILGSRATRQNKQKATSQSTSEQGSNK